MKNLILVLSVFLALAPCVRAEVIDSVTFNPARLGQYEHLKVTNKFTSTGGVTAKDMGVESLSAVSVSSSGGYDIPTVEVVSGSAVSMPNTQFKNSTTSQTFQSAGGDASFASSVATSNINKLSSTVLRLRADNLITPTLSIEGSSTSVTDYEGSNGRHGLNLGNVEIPPLPASCGSSSSLAWAERVDDSGSRYKVLGANDCTQGNITVQPFCGACYNSTLLEDGTVSCVPKALCLVGQTMDPVTCECTGETPTLDKTVRWLSIVTGSAPVYRTCSGYVGNLPHCSTSSIKPSGVWGAHSVCLSTIQFREEVNAKPVPSSCSSPETSVECAACTPGTIYFGYPGLPSGDYMCGGGNSNLGTENWKETYQVYYLYQCYDGDEEGRYLPTISKY